MFNSVPQRRAKRWNTHWTANAIETKKKKRLVATRLAANRAKIAKLEAAVKRGDIKPRILPPGRPVNIPLANEEPFDI